MNLKQVSKLFFSLLLIRVEVYFKTDIDKTD